MIPDPTETPTVTVDEAAAMLGIARSTAYAAVRDGQIPSIRIGTRWLVPTAALRQLVGIDARVS